MQKAGVMFVALFVAYTLAGAAVSRAEEIDRGRFMREFARFAVDTLDQEQRIREMLDAFILKNEKAVGEGFGSHPEFVPAMFEEAGIEKLACMSGRYYELFGKELENEERQAFYQTKSDLTYWVAMMAVEEAVRLKVLDPSPPLSFRQQGDVPFFIAKDIRSRMQPYLSGKPGGGGQGKGFDDLVCE